MDPIILTVVIAGGVVFLFVLAGKLAWFIRKMEEAPRDEVPERSGDSIGAVQSRAGEEDEGDTGKGVGSRAASSD